MGLFKLGQFKNFIKMEIKPYQWVEAYSLTPSRLSIFARKTTLVGYKSYEPTTLKNDVKDSRLENIYKGSDVATARFHNFQISEQARKSMQLKINWLYFMAKSRYKKSLSGRELFNFKMNFITLTLPSKQVHSTGFITKNVFNQFMTEIRTFYNMENFVWRLEFQKNGNVHYHIVTDTFTDFHIVQKVWNRCLNKLGYVDAYARKHSLMTLNDYVSAYSKNGATPFVVLQKRYSFGRRTNWTAPNSVDVKAVSNGKAISMYISKYFSKKENKNNNCNELDNIENSVGLRLWFCSRSLSKLKTISDFVEASGRDLFFIISTAKNTFKVIHDFCTSYYFSFSDLWNEAKGVVHKVLYSYAISLFYKPAT